MIKNEDYSMLACMSMLSNITDLNEIEVYDLLSQEQKVRFETCLQFSEQNQYNKEAQEQSKNQLIDMLKKL